MAASALGHDGEYDEIIVEDGLVDDIEDFDDHQAADEPAQASDQDADEIDATEAEAEAEAEADEALEPEAPEAAAASSEPDASDEGVAQAGESDDAESGR